MPRTRNALGDEPPPDDGEAFLRSLPHELSTRLALISGYADLLTTMHSSALPEASQEIQCAVGEIANLVHQIPRHLNARRPAPDAGLLFRELVGDLSNQLALAVGNAELLTIDPGMPKDLLEIAQEALRGAESAAEAIRQFHRRLAALQDGEQST